MRGVLEGVRGTHRGILRLRRVTRAYHRLREEFIETPVADPRNRGLARRLDLARDRVAHAAMVLARSSLAAWKRAVQDHADRLEVVAGDPLWGEGDPYDLEEAALAAHAAGEDPRAFVERAFAEDLAARDHDEDLERQSLEEGSCDEEYE
jgi:hypothetical protein